MNIEKPRNSVAAPKKDPKSGKWRFVFDSVHPNPDESRRQILRRGFETRSEAKAELDRLRREDAELIAPLDGTLTVGMVLDQFVRAKRLAGKAPNTISQYEWATAQAKARWEGWSADRLTGDQPRGRLLRTTRRRTSAVAAREGNRADRKAHE